MAGLALEERRVLEGIADEARSEGRLSKPQWERLRDLFGERFDKAWRLVEEGRAKRYVFQPSGRVMWIVVGQTGEYMVLPEAGYCSCNDFFFRVVDGEEGVCYHLLGQRLAEALGSYEEVAEEDEFYEPLMEEWKQQMLEED